MLYRVCGLMIESNIPLPELTPADSGEAEFAFQFLSGDEFADASARWFHHWRLPHGNKWLGFAKQGPDYLLRFPDLADFQISLNSREIRCSAKKGTPAETIRHLLLDQVIPLVLSNRGSLVLHAAAVATREGAVAFLGRTGLGKSTLTASFATRGFPLLTDDGLLITEQGEHLLGTASYPGLRLWPDIIAALFPHEPELAPVAHYTGKRRLVIGDTHLPSCADSVPLRRVYVLDDPEETGSTGEIKMRFMAPRDVFIELVKHTFDLDITDRERLRQKFHFLARVVEFPLFYRLTYPRELSALPAVHEAILAHVKD